MPRRLLSTLTPLILVGLLAGGLEAKRRSLSAAELTNIHLSPEYSQWLVGAIGRMATNEEVESYLEIREDAEAERFIQQFWAERSSWARWPEPSAREVFEERAQEADRLFSEAAYPGRRTDRGAVFIVYGASTERDYEVPPVDGQPPIEVWRYGPDAAKGLDGRSPAKKIFRFQERDGLTRFYDPLSAARP
jgi:GWxTD domain-containing protein